MSDDSAENIRRPDLNNRDLAWRLERAFKHNKISEVCPFCGTDVWTIETFPNLEPAIPMMAPGGGIPLAVISVIALACNKCGFVRLHGKRQIERLLGASNGE